MLFTKIGYGILIPINKDYTVRANINCVDRDTNKYTYDYEIKENEVGKFDTLAFGDKYEIESKSVNVDVAKETLARYKEGFFDDIIKCYDYEIRCMNAGINMDENKK